MSTFAIPKWWTESRPVLRPKEYEHTLFTGERVVVTRVDGTEFGHYKRPSHAADRNDRVVLHLPSNCEVCCSHSKEGCELFAKLLAQTVVDWSITDAYKLLCEMRTVAEVVESDEPSLANEHDKGRLGYCPNCECYKVHPEMGCLVCEQERQQIERSKLARPRCGTTGR